MIEKIEDLVSIVFLPLYFAYSGLNTSLGLINTGEAWAMVILVITTACAGKIIGVTLTSRYTGMNWREAFSVGILMNTKGYLSY